MTDSLNGPWGADGRLFGDFYDICDRDARLVARVALDAQTGVAGTMRRVRLIEAAPQLLDAAEKLVAVSTQFELRGGEISDTDPDFAALTTALRDLALVVMKARGRTLDQVLEEVLKGAVARG